MGLRSNVVRQQHEEAMDGAQMRSLVEALGMGRRDVATLVGVNESTVRRWWANESTVPAAAVTHLSRWAHDSHELEQQLLIPLTCYLFAICLEDALLKHASGKDLEHPATFVHALLLGGLITTASALGQKVVGQGSRHTLCHHR